MGIEICLIKILKKIYN